MSTTSTRLQDAGVDGCPGTHQWADAPAQDGIGQHADATDIDEHGGVAQVGHRQRAGADVCDVLHGSASIGHRHPGIAGHRRASVRGRTSTTGGHTARRSSERQARGSRRTARRVSGCAGSEGCHWRSPPLSMPMARTRRAPALPSERSLTVATYAEPARLVLTVRSRAPGWLIRNWAPT